MRNSAANLFTKKEMFSEQQLNIYAGGSFSGWGAQAKATFNLDKKAEQHVVICKITQKYFTIDVPVQNSIDLVSDSIIDNDALYISSVSYGRIGYLSIKSSISTEKINAAVNAIYSNPSMSATAEASLGISNFLSTSEINGFTYGGNPITVTNIKDFFKYIKDGDVRDNGLAVKPIFYKTKFLRSGKDAFVSMTTDYNETQCEPYKQFSLTLRGPSVNVIHNGDCKRAWGTIDAEVWETNNDGILERQIFPLTDNGQIENVTRMMEWPNYGQVTNITDYQLLTGKGANPWGVKNINTVNKTWNYKINPDKINKNQAVVIVKTYLGSQHKWADLSDDHKLNAGMSGTEQKRVPILENTGKEVEVGPYTSPYRADHSFRAHFNFGIK
jgi:Thiol-activated cytolysin